MSDKKSFWTTVPGILTGTAGIITAMGGLLLVLHQVGVIGLKGQEQVLEKTETEPMTKPESTHKRQPVRPVSERDDAVQKAWEILSAHRGNLTDAVDDCVTFQEVVLEYGRLEQPYTLDLGGKQNLGRFVITVLNEYPYSPSPEITYHYKEFTTSLEVGDKVSHSSSVFRKIKGSDDTWEEISDSP